MTRDEEHAPTHMHILEGMHAQLWISVPVLLSPSSTSGLDYRVVEVFDCVKLC